MSARSLNAYYSNIGSVRMRLHDNLTSAQRLIVLASRLSFSDEDEQELAKLVKEKLDWFQIFRMAVKNKVIPLIGSNLEILPYKILQAPRHKYAAEQASELFSEHILKHLLIQA